jgi:hypothetical protein
MGATASVLPETLSVEPGGETSVFVQVTNTGDVVDEFTFEVLGEAARWTTLDPPAMSLYPGSEREVRLVFAPPRSPDVPAGRVDFGLRVASTEDPGSSFVEEAEVEVLPYDETAAELTPRTSHGRTGAKHEIAFDNRGNAPVNADFDAWDAENVLAFTFKPPALDAGAGSAVFSSVRIRPRKRFLRGAPKTRAFEIHVRPEAAEPTTLHGTYVQDALLPRWLLPAVLALAVLGGLWALVLKPEIESTAQEAVEQPLAEQEQKIAAVEQSAAAAETDAEVAQTDAAEAKEEAAAATDEAGTAQSTAEGASATAKQAQIIIQGEQRGTPTNFRLEVACPPTCTVEHVVPDGQTFSLTDIVLGNPRGDAGTLTVKRNDTPLLVQSLENFRDLDFHFIAPLLIDEGQRLVLEVECANGQVAAAGAAGTILATPTGACTDAAYVAGFEKPKPQPEE